MAVDSAGVPEVDITDILSRFAPVEDERRHRSGVVVIVVGMADTEGAGDEGASHDDESDEHTEGQHEAVHRRDVRRGARPARSALASPSRVRHHRRGLCARLPRTVGLELNRRMGAGRRRRRRRPRPALQLRSSRPRDHIIHDGPVRGQCAFVVGLACCPIFEFRPVAIGPSPLQRGWVLFQADPAHVLAAQAPNEDLLAHIVDLDYGASQAAASPRCVVVAHLPVEAPVAGFAE
mmetsp:Transcript_109524/g.315420  ORF Transcript_109524/g.315420 Transcript_109524/m.315420 type:complete len:235 (-) Transcript_109524:1676-2380(-)